MRGCRVDHSLFFKFIRPYIKLIVPLIELSRSMLGVLLRLALTGCSFYTVFCIIYFIFSLNKKKLYLFLLSNFFITKCITFVDDDFMIL